MSSYRELGSGVFGTAEYDENAPPSPIVAHNPARASINRGEVDEQEVTEATSLLAQSGVIETEKIVGEETGKSLGEKEINSWLSVIFIVNQIYGPGVLSIPIVFQQAGWVIVVIALTFFLAISAFASTLLCEAITMIPGNKNWERRIEYTTCIEYYYGRKWHLVFQVFLNITLQVYNIASIIVCAQSLDQFVMYIFHRTWALEFYPHAGFTEFRDINDLYGSSALTISLGYVLICILCIPMGMTNLEKNVKIVQTASFAFLVFLLVEFIVQFGLEHPKLDRVPAFGDQYLQVASVFIFSWAYPMFIPSWANEKQPHVSVNKAVWISGISSWVGYLFIGLLAALAFPKIEYDDMLGLMADPAQHMPIFTVVCTYLFALGVIAPGIPVCSITIRYNLFVAKICGKWASFFWGVVSPWLVSWIFAQGVIFAMLINWSSLVFNGLVNFVIPLCVYWTATSRKNRPPDWQSSVQPYPKWMNRYARGFTMFMIVTTSLVIGLQIVADLVFTIAYNDNILGN